MASLDDSHIISLQTISLDKEDFKPGASNPASIVTSNAGFSFHNSVTPDINISLAQDIDASTTPFLEEVDNESEINAEVNANLEWDDQNIGSTKVTYTDMLDIFQRSGKMKRVSIEQFKQIFDSIESISAKMTRGEIMLCLDQIKQSTQDKEMYFVKSRKMDKLVSYLYSSITGQLEQLSKIGPPKRKKKRNHVKLSKLCKKVIRRFPKWILNVSECEFLDEYNRWKGEIPFAFPTKIEALSYSQDIIWFSKPEYNLETLSPVFAFLDVHHLITNCRTKVCKHGFPERVIFKEAWKSVARENNLKIPHVDDLVDKQSDAIAGETFSVAVEERMNHLGFSSEANFCKIVREFYDAEDEPGLSPKERCERRLKLRECLLDGVNFYLFPPYGNYIRGIPYIMFQGFLTNIERRIQIAPYTKSGAYNFGHMAALRWTISLVNFKTLILRAMG